MKRILLALVLVSFSAVAATAGDVPSLVNLGFSADSGYFLFGQYGIDPVSGNPYAELYLVDTKRNDFVPSGVARQVFPVVLEPGQDPAGALYELYAAQQPLIKKHRISHLSQGRLVYVLLNGAPQTDVLAFRDFKNDNAYEIKLAQSVSGKDGAATSSFGISVTVTGKDGSVRRFEAGDPTWKRAGVSGYAIRQVLVAPDERTLVFVVEKKLAADKGAGLRYMVETVGIP